MSADSENRFGRAPNRKAATARRPTIAWLAIAALASVATCSTVSALQPAAAVQQASQPDADALCDRNGAQGQLLIAMAQGIVKGYEPGSASVVMVVRRGPWDDLSMMDQKRLVSSLDCSIAGPGQIIGGVHVRDEPAGDDLATFDNIALLDLREQGFDRPPTTKGGASK
jgi:hypothetical protein